MRVAVLSLLKCAKGGISLTEALDMSQLEFEDWIAAANALEKQIEEAMKG